jgi:hypothetical protein
MLLPLAPCLSAEQSRAVDLATRLGSAPRGKSPGHGARGPCNTARSSCRPATRSGVETGRRQLSRSSFARNTDVFARVFARGRPARHHFDFSPGP